MEHVALELQGMAGIDAGFGRARETSKSGQYKVILGMPHDALSPIALELSRDLLMAAINNEPFDVGQAVEHLHDLADRLLLGPSTGCIAMAAQARGIPQIRLNEGNLVQLGYGAAQRRIWTAETDQTSAIAEGISRDKDLTKSLLSACGVPVPEGRLTHDADDAWEAAQDIGLPVVVKPQDGNHGRGVFVNLRDEAAVRAAYEVAREEGSAVLVERFIEGNEHRLLVVGGKVVAAAMGEAATVTGDAVHSVASLIELQLNSDPRRGTTQDTPFNRIHVDSAVHLELKQQGLTPESVPAQGVRVLVQRMGSVGMDITEKVHPQVAAVAALAARIVGLDIAGIDLVSLDIGKPLSQTKGAIVEVNAGPGLLMHLRPSAGSPRPVGEAIVEQLFAQGRSARIPVIGVAGTQTDPWLAPLIAHLIQMSGVNTALACTSGLYLGRRKARGGDCTRFDIAQQAVINRLSEAAVIETNAERLAVEGLPYDRCRIGVVTSLDVSQQMPQHWIDSEDLMIRVMRTQVDVVLKDGASVLNAHDDHVVELAPLSDGEVVFYATDATLPAVQVHLAQGGKAVLREGQSVVLAEGGNVQRLNFSGKALVRMERLSLLGAVLPALATAWAMGVGIDVMRTAIASFEGPGQVAASGGSSAASALSAL
jgi:cyanophycin synthetase